ncbi:hypothetical protein LZ32DRAFT_89565 [Colletotrichum eremochloae]|nr:hypothetical protein LZ32DRAFT_89565 [Colletotrichum eremochloae]
MCQECCYSIPTYYIKVSYFARYSTSVLAASTNENEFNNPGPGLPAPAGRHCHAWLPSPNHLPTLTRRPKPYQSNNPPITHSITLHRLIHRLPPQVTNDLV